MKASPDWDDQDLSLRALIHGWRMVAILVIAGGLLGWLASAWLRPRYEARAVMAVNIQYGVTVPLELVIEDRALNRVETIIEADDTLESLLQALPSELRSARGWHQPADLDAVLRLDRRLSDWELVAVDEDPQVAATVVQAWAMVSLQAIREAQAHAWQAVALMSGPFEVECQRLATPAPDTDRSGIRCAVLPLELAPQALEGRLQSELELSRGVLPNLTVELTRQAAPPSEPVLWRRSWMVGGGALAGLLTGLFLVLLPPWLWREGNLDGA